MKLYDIVNELNAIKDMMEYDEVDATLYKDTLDAIELEFKDKADNICCIIKEWKANIEAIKVEEKALKERRQALEKKAGSLHTYLEDALRSQDMRKLDTARNKITIRKNPKSIVINDMVSLINWAEQIGVDEDVVKYTVDISKSAVNDLIKKGIDVPFIEVVQKESMIIK